MKPWMLALLILLALAAIGAAGYFGYYGFQPPAPGKAAQAETPPATVPVERGDVRQLVSAPGELVETRQASLAFGVAGQVAGVSARPGDAVKKGQELARLGDPAKYEAAAAAARVELLTARQELEDLRASAPKAAADAHAALVQAKDDYEKAKTLVEALKYPRASQERLDGVYADYQKALQNVAIAQDRYDDVAGVAPDNPKYVDALQALTGAQKEKDRLLGTYNWLTAKPTEKEIEERQAKLEQAQAAFDSAQRAYQRLKNGPDATALELAQARVADKEQTYTRAQDDLAHLSLKAPFDGVITAVKVAAGDAVTAAQQVITLTNTAALEAQVTVVEEDYALIRPGQAVQLYFDAQPDAQVTGRVARIVPSRTDAAAPQYPVYVEIDNLPERVAAGMTVDAAIVIAEKQGVLVLPKALVRARSDGSATVQVWADGRKESREITIGLIGDSHVEVISGLEEGEQVVGQ